MIWNGESMHSMNANTAYYFFIYTFLFEYQRGNSQYATSKDQ